MKKIENYNIIFRTAANGMTMLRMIGTVILLFLTPASLLFLGIYTVTGLTDVLDGWLARRTGTASELGARLDSAADLLFYAVMLIKLLSVLRKTIPLVIWCEVGVVLLVRLSAYVTAAIKYHCFASLHTYLNKLTGASIFALPYVLLVSSGVVYSQLICVLAFAASLEELVLHLHRPCYCADTKSVFRRKRQGSGE